MDLNSWKRIVEAQQQQLLQILSDCQDGSDELILLSSKMSPLLQELQEHMNAVVDTIHEESANDTKAPDEK